MAAFALPSAAGTTNWTAAAPFIPLLQLGNVQQYLFSFDGYLPVAAFIKVIFKILNNFLRPTTDSTPFTHALRGFLSLSKLV
ncbi:hypothetical protein PtB15_14B341 [Puccinia triticina]|nr:hypothetical protein PtB15_14B341 [Puccinia triticina]